MRDTNVSTQIIKSDGVRQGNFFRNVQLKIDKELQAGRMLGPFDQAPFPQCHISPIKIVKKSDPGKFRLIQNLSWPYDDSSINSHIPDESKTVKYTTVSKAIKLIMSFPLHYKQSMNTMLSMMGVWNII